jgi:hypothetical protein
VIVNLTEEPKGCEEAGSRTLERNDARIKEANLAPISRYPKVYAAGELAISEHCMKDINSPPMLS